MNKVKKREELPECDDWETNPCCLNCNHSEIMLHLNERTTYECTIYNMSGWGDEICDKYKGYYDALF